jgi:hypothetical protein
MTIALASAWNPRGEFSRFETLHPWLLEEYVGMAISLPPDTDPQLARKISALPRVGTIVTEHWSHGRYMALKLVEEIGATHVQYADFDRLLRWVETYPEEWKHVLKQAQEVDCLILGRSPAAYQTHPKALVETEAISNMVVSFLLGRTLDVSAGSKCFSKDACRTILANSVPGNALGTDAEWPIIMKHSGFTVNYLEVDGLEWESADRYQDKAADRYSQETAATRYDADPENWSRRVAIAMEIVKVGLDTIDSNLSTKSDTGNRIDC